MNLPRTRKVLAVHGDGQLRRIEEPVPPLESGMVLVAVKASLVSPGSEFGGGWPALRQLQLNPDGRQPKKFGYSNAGVVLNIGPGVSGLAEGDRVACVGNNYAQHTDYAVVPQNLVFKLPEGVGDEQASYSMLLATGLQALRRGGVEFGEYVAIAGLGLVGLLAARLAQLAGCRVIGWDTNPVRIEYARQLGIGDAVLVGKENVVERTRAFTSGQGLDHGIIAIGGNTERPYDSLMECMKVSPDGHAYGNIVVVGGADFPYKKNLSNVNIVRSSRTGPGYHDKEWERGADYPAVFVRWDTRRNIEFCIELLEQGKIDVDRLTSHTIPFDQVEERTAEATKLPDEILGMVFTM